MKELDEVGLFVWGFRGRDAVDAIAGVGRAPCLDETPEGVVWGEVGLFGERLFGYRTARVGTLEQPSLDAVTIVGYARFGCNGVFHDLKRNGADEVARNFYFIVHEL